MMNPGLLISKCLMQYQGINCLCINRDGNIQVHWINKRRHPTIIFLLHYWKEHTFLYAIQAMVMAIYQRKQMVPEKWTVCDTANNVLIPSDNHDGFMVYVTIAVRKNIHEYFGRTSTRILLQRDDRQYKLVEVAQTKFS